MFNKTQIANSRKCSRRGGGQNVFSKILGGFIVIFYFMTKSIAKKIFRWKYLKKEFKNIFDSLSIHLWAVSLGKI